MTHLSKVRTKGEICFALVCTGKSIFLNAEITDNLSHQVLKVAGYRLNEEQMHNVLDEVDTNRNGKIELGEFLQFMSAVKAGKVTNNAFIAAAGLDEKSNHAFGPERSGGGV